MLRKFIRNILNLKTKTERRTEAKVFKRLEEFKCPEHGIFVSPSTFEYQNRLENLLWKDTLDQDLLFNGVFGFKRETEKIARDNSEDAVPWNVFRYLEKQKLLSGFLSSLYCF